MTDKEKEEEIKMKGQAKSAFTGFLADPTSARKPKDFENHFPGGKIDLKSLNNKDKDWAEKLRGNPSGEPKIITEKEPRMKTHYFIKERTEETAAKIDWRKVQVKLRPHKSAKKIQIEKDKEGKEKTRVEREVIIHGIPSLTIDRPDHRKEMESIKEVFAELSPMNLAEGGIKVKGSDIVTANRQMMHRDTEKLPFTVLFREKAIADKVRAAAIKAGIWNKRKPKVSPRSNPETTKEATKEGTKVTKKAQNKALPTTFIRAARTQMERDFDPSHLQGN